MGLLHSTERCMVRAMCGVPLNDRKRFADLMFILGLNESMDQLAVTNSVRWCGHVLWRDDGHVLRMALDFEVEGQRKKGRLKRIWKRQVEDESVMVGFRREDALCRSEWSVGVNTIAAGLRSIWPPSHLGDTTLNMVLKMVSLSLYIAGCIHVCHLGSPFAIKEWLEHPLNCIFGMFQYKVNFLSKRFIICCELNIDIMLISTFMVLKSCMDNFWMQMEITKPR